MSTGLLPTDMPATRRGSSSDLHTVAYCLVTANTALLLPPLTLLPAAFVSSPLSTAATSSSTLSARLTPVTGLTTVITAAIRPSRLCPHPAPSLQ